MSPLEQNVWLGAGVVCLFALFVLVVAWAQYEEAKERDEELRRAGERGEIGY